MSFMDDCLRDLDTVFLTAESGALAASYDGGASILVLPLARGATIQDPEAGPNEMTILVKSADVAWPQEGKAFTISSDTWYVKAILSGGPEFGAWTVALTTQSRRRL